MSDYPMLISNKLHSFRNFFLQNYNNYATYPKERDAFHASFPRIEKNPYIFRNK